MAPVPMNEYEWDVEPGGSRTPGACIRSADCEIPAPVEGAVVVVGLMVVVVAAGAGAPAPDPVPGVASKGTAESVGCVACEEVGTVVVVVVGGRTSERAGDRWLDVVGPPIDCLCLEPVAASVSLRPCRVEGCVPPVTTSNAMSASDTARITHQLGRARGTRRASFAGSVPPPTNGTPYARATPSAPAKFRRRVAAGPGLVGHRAHGGRVR